MLVFVALVGVGVGGGVCGGFDILVSVIVAATVKRGKWWGLVLVSVSVLVLVVALV